LISAGPSPFRTEARRRSAARPHDKIAGFVGSRLVREPHHLCRDAGILRSAATLNIALNIEVHINRASRKQQPLSILPC
jgi:hypothetical protein